MKQFFIALCLAAITIAQVNGYSAGGGGGYQGNVGGDYQVQGADLSGVLGSGLGGGLGTGHIVSSASAGASVNVGNAGLVGSDYVSGSVAGGSVSGQYYPQQNVNTVGHSVSSSFSYPNNKGEILVHRPATIIVKRPPTKVLVNHPPLVVKPAPVVLHRPPAVVVRKVVVKHHPRPVKVEPVYVNVVKPPAKKYYYNINSSGYGSSNAGSVAGGETSGGYQLVQNGQGLAGSQSSGYVSSSHSAGAY